MWRDLAVALSLANLCYLRIWSEVLTYRLGDTFWMKAPPGPADYMAVMMNVSLVGLLFWVGIRVIRGSRNHLIQRAGRGLFLVLLLVPLNAIRVVLSNRIPYLKSDLFSILSQTEVELLAFLLALAGILALLLFQRQLTRIAAIVLLILFPFTPMAFVQAMTRTLRHTPAAYADKPLAPPISVKDKPKTRVLWVIFDEMDYRLAFVDRDPSLQLPEFDRFRRESIFAEHGESPGPGTPISMPSLFIGKSVQTVEAVRPDGLLLTLRGSREKKAWNELPNLFTKARKLGVNTAVVDWYIPSCRVFSSLFVSCSWWEMGMQYNSMGARFPEILINQTRSLFETSLFSPFGQSLATKQQVGTYQAILNQTKRVVTDLEFGLVFAHFPVPHAPHAYDRKTGQFTLANSPIHGYVDSLALADRTLGELRRQMERVGTWTSTTILVSADHPYREASALDGKMDSRVPFLLKLASQKEGKAYDGCFSALLTQDLLLRILDGDLRTPEEVIRWLDEQSAVAEPTSADSSCRRDGREKKS